MKCVNCGLEPPMVKLSVSKGYTNKMCNQCKYQHYGNPSNKILLGRLTIKQKIDLYFKDK